MGGAGKNYPKRNSSMRKKNGWKSCDIRNGRPLTLAASEACSKQHARRELIKEKTSKRNARRKEKKIKSIEKREKKRIRERKRKESHKNAKQRRKLRKLKR